MAFWQSPEWMARVDSIYKLDPAKGDPDFLPWWKEVWILFRRRKRYDIILTMGIRESFTFAALCSLFSSPCCHIMTEVFIDNPSKPGLFWRLKTAWYRRLAPFAAGIITNSSAEIATNAARFGLPVDRFYYVPLNTTIADPSFEPRPDGYLFCAGRTLRDYPTLLEVMRATDFPWHVVVGANDMNGMDIPPQVTVHREINRERYLELLRGARIVVLPLLPTERATGQVVLLEAMSYGKPVITTRAPGTTDIVRDGENGFLTESGNHVMIKNILRVLLQDAGECQRIGQNALQDIISQFTTQKHAERRLKAIDAIWSDSTSPLQPNRR